MNKSIVTVFTSPEKFFFMLICLDTRTNKNGTATTAKPIKLNEKCKQKTVLMFKLCELCSNIIMLSANIQLLTLTA